MRVNSMRPYLAGADHLHRMATNVEALSLRSHATWMNEIDLISRQIFIKTHATKMKVFVRFCLYLTLTTVLFHSHRCCCRHLKILEPAENQEGSLNVVCRG